MVDAFPGSEIGALEHRTNALEEIRRRVGQELPAQYRMFLGPVGGELYGLFGGSWAAAGVKSRRAFNVSRCQHRIHVVVLIGGI